MKSWAKWFERQVERRKAMGRVVRDPVAVALAASVAEYVLRQPAPRIVDAAVRRKL